MRIRKLYSPWSPHFWSPLFKQRYGLEDYDYRNRQDRKEPIIVFGMYGGGTKSQMMNHQGLIVIVWSGSDSLRLNEHPNFVEYCKLNEHRIFHIAHSHWIQTDLGHFGLKYIDKVVIPRDLSMFSFEKECGKSVYHYGTHQRKWYYGTEVLEKLELKWRKNPHYPKIIRTVQDAYKLDELYNLYKDSFLGVRLTEHDNMAMSVVEMGLMGRRSIFNGNVPCAISYPVEPYSYNPDTKRRWVWQDKEEMVTLIGNMILNYKYYFNGPDRLLAEEMEEFIYDDGKWLNTEYYE